MSRSRILQFLVMLAALVGVAGFTANTLPARATAAGGICVDPLAFGIFVTN